MPVYDYKCEDCQQVKEIFLRLSNLSLPMKCTCGGELKRQLSAPRILPDYPGYSCPITGKWIEGRRAHKENLKKHGCRVLETGETEALSRRKKWEDEALEERIAEGAVQEFLKLPDHKKGAIAHELEHGAEAPIIRM